MSMNFLEVALVAALAGEASGKVVQIADLAGKVACTSLQGTIKKQAGGYQWTCQPNDRVSCDSESLEPIDLDGAMCDALPVLDKRARLAILKLPVDSADSTAGLAVEWRGIGRSGTQILATRNLKARSIHLSPRARILRILREHASPVSFAFPFGFDDVTVEIPGAGRGGELLGRLDRRGTLLPTSIRVAGPKASEIAVSKEGFFSISNLPPGIYSLTALFAGHQAGDSFTARVDDEKSTEVFSWVLPRVGAIRASLLPELCDQAVGLHVVGAKMKNRREAPLQFGSSGCGALFSGMAPGTYEVGIRRKDGSTSSSLDVEVRAGESANVDFSESLNKVVGTVTFNGTPVREGTRLGFLPEGRSTEIQVFTSARGKYEVYLPVPGKCRISVLSTQALPSRWFTTVIAPGESSYDIQLTGALLRVRIRNSEEVTSVVQLHIDGTTRFAGFGTSIDLPEIELMGIEPGEYFVSADTSGMTSERSQVVLEANKTTVLDLHLVSSVGAILTVASERGGEIPDAVVSTDYVRQLDHLGRGVFSLDRVATGAPLAIKAPGHLPSCSQRTGPPTEDMGITLAVLTNSVSIVRLRDAPERLHTPIGEMSSPLLGNCALWMLDPMAKRDGKDLVITLLGLPPGDYLYRPGSNAPWKTLSVPGPELEFTYKPVSRPSPKGDSN